MKRTVWIVLLLSLLTGQMPAGEPNWPQWRGPDGNGQTAASGVVTEWGPQRNVRWRVALPEPGNSTPIVWEDRVFITQPLGTRELVVTLPRRVSAFAPADGELLWTCGGAAPLAYASPMESGGVIVASGGYRGASLAVRAGGGTWSSVTQTADGLMFLLTKSGTTTVFRSNREKLDQVAENALNETTNASVVIAGQELFLRTDQALWCFSEK